MRLRDGVTRPSFEQVAIVGRTDLGDGVTSNERLLVRRAAPQSSSSGDPRVRDDAYAMDDMMLIADSDDIRPAFRWNAETGVDISRHCTSVQATRLKTSASKGKRNDEDSPL